MVRFTLLDFPKTAFYCPHSEAGEGYVFTGVCHSVTEQGAVTPNASWDRSHDQVEVDNTYPPPRPGSEVNHQPPGCTGGRYASYWNAFLLKQKIVVVKVTRSITEGGRRKFGSQ